MNKQLLIKNANLFDFPIHRPYYKLSNEQQDLIWTGNDHFKGINYFFQTIKIPFLLLIKIQDL